MTWWPPMSDPTQRADEVPAGSFAGREIDEDKLTRRRQVLHSTSHRR